MRDAEVENLHVTIALQEDIPRLHVSMDDALLVGIVEPAAHLKHHGDLVLEGQRWTGLDETPQLLAFQ